MSDRKTIADSKRAFHVAFPHVIPPLYRRLADELLVELHLLSHQKGFKPNALFAIGLSKVFESFTEGYRPQEHLHNLFNALCSSNGFDPNHLRQLSDKMLKAVESKTTEELELGLKNTVQSEVNTISNEIEMLRVGNAHYSRLMAIGLTSIFATSKGDESQSPEDYCKIATKVSESMGLPKARVEKDLNLYLANLEKMSQAMELMAETRAREVNKR